MQLLSNHTYTYLVYQKSLEISIFWPGLCTVHCPEASNVGCAKKRLPVWLPDGLWVVPGNFFPLNLQIKILSVHRIVQSQDQLTILQDPYFKLGHQFIKF